MSNTYYTGAVVRVSGSFTDINGAAIDPTTVIFMFKDPAGATTSYTYGVDGQLVKDSTGNYHVDVASSLSGTTFYRFKSTGTGQAAQEGSFFTEANF